MQALDASSDVSHVVTDGSTAAALSAKSLPAVDAVLCGDEVSLSVREAVHSYRRDAHVGV